MTAGIDGLRNPKTKPMEDSMNEYTMSVEPGTPARVDAARAAKLLGFSEHDIPTLVRARLLKPLGGPLANNAPRYFATCELARLANDVTFLNQATKVITQYWKDKNARRAKSQLTAVT
jgi:hypothetical protein